MNNEILFNSLSKIIYNYKDKQNNQFKSWVKGYIHSMLGRNANKSDLDLLNLKDIQSIKLIFSIKDDKLNRLQLKYLYDNLKDIDSNSISKMIEMIEESGYNYIEVENIKKQFEMQKNNHDKLFNKELEFDDQKFIILNKDSKMNDEIKNFQSKNISTDKERKEQDPKFSSNKKVKISDNKSHKKLEKKLEKIEKTKIINEMNELNETRELFNQVQKENRNLNKNENLKRDRKILEKDINTGHKIVTSTNHSSFRDKKGNQINMSKNDINKREEFRKKHKKGNKN